MRRLFLLVVLAGLALPLTNATAQQARRILWEPVISIVWPHDAQGAAVPVASASLVNVSV